MVQFLSVVNAYVTRVYEFWGTVVPEPATWLLLALGSVAVVGRRRGHAAIADPKVR